ncbi:LysE family translocator [Fulvivirga lutea]|uniref:LysE family transporter n=1 Tax=Fulvivirga lutea TaxID=2810512 RepID=A0A975A1U5_9BACT|nr:LysE family transporter [Fulvivirga lutea]QSE98590.1 LysE family transporter [Fulvivirga lutea]
MITVFLFAFLFSFIGSIPPGAINISVLQLAIENKSRAAIRFSLASAIIEFPYVIIAVIFSDWLLSTEIVMNNIKLLSTSVILLLAFINTYQYFKNDTPKPLTNKGGFRRGMIVSIFNPLAIPFWVGITAYLSNQGWMSIDNNSQLLTYALGVSAGTFALLFALINFSTRINLEIKNQKLTKLIPAVVFFILGFYGIWQLLIDV